MSDRLDKLQSLWQADQSDADVAYMIAQEHAKAGKTDDATAWYDTCLELNPAYHYAYFHKARALQTGGDMLTALAVAKQGLDRATNAADAKASSELAGLVDELEQS